MNKQQEVLGVCADFIRDQGTETSEQLADELLEVRDDLQTLDTVFQSLLTCLDDQLPPGFSRQLVIKFDERGLSTSLEIETTSGDMRVGTVNIDNRPIDVDLLIPEWRRSFIQQMFAR